MRIAAKDLEIVDGITCNRSRVVLDVQLDAFVTSGGGSYWIYCPKARNASHADINWKPAAATSASGRSRPSP